MGHTCSAIFAYRLICMRKFASHRRRSRSGREFFCLPIGVKGVRRREEGTKKVLACKGREGEINGIIY